MILRRIGIILLLIALFPASVYAGDPAWEKYISSQKKVQVQTHHRLALHAKHLKPLIEKSQELQLLLADERSARFYYLYNNQPGRIARTHGFAAFVNFEWSMEDTEKLMAEDKRYRKMKEKIQRLTEEVENDSGWEELKQQLSRLEEDVKYRDIISTFRFVPDEVEKILASERPDDRSIDAVIS